MQLVACAPVVGEEQETDGDLRHEQRLGQGQKVRRDRSRPAAAPVENAARERGEGADRDHRRPQPRMDPRHAARVAEARAIPVSSCQYPDMTEITASSKRRPYAYWMELPREPAAYVQVPAPVTLTVSAVDWLLGSDEPGIVAQARRDLLDEQAPAEAARVLEGPKVRTLLAGQQADGGFGTNVYAKWGGAHWRLVSLVELGVPAGEQRCLAAAETVLAWLTGKGHRGRIEVIDGLTRRCASQEGNALAVCCRLGLADDPRVRLLAESLVEWQWPDGGWNCDKKAGATARRSTSRCRRCGGCTSTGRRPARRAARDAAVRTAELLLEHRLFRALANRGADPRVVRDSALPAVLALRLLPGAGRARPDGARRDPRAADGLDLLEERRLPDGRWRAGGRWWRTPGSKGSNVEVVDWGSGANELLTLHALRVLRAAGRFSA